MATKYIFITGGVVSSLGKGVAASSVGAILEGARFHRRDDEARPLRERRSGDHVPVPARRGFRHRRRRRGGSRPGALRALHDLQDEQEAQLHDRQDLRDGDQQGAARRLPGQHGPGHPPRDGRDQGRDAAACGQRGRHPGRDRRHRRRHRIAALPGGDPPVPPGVGPQQRGESAPHPGALHRRLRRAEDEAHPALGARVAGHRHLAGHPAVPGGP